MPLPELVEAGDLLRLEGPGLLVVPLRDDDAILVYEVDFTTRHSGERMRRHVRFGKQPRRGHSKPPNNLLNLQ